MRKVFEVTGESKDIETVIRLRPWIEDESRKEYGDFNETRLITDYDQKRNIFSFRIDFYKTNSS
jgi:hypothetical protein